MAIVLDGTTGITTPALDTETRIAPTDLGTGIPDATNFLRGDGTWQTISTTPTTDQVLTATAGASVGAVGTYALLRGSAVISLGGTRAGSLLAYADARGSNSYGTPAGTWMAMGGIQASGDYGVRATVWLRIS
jgi:hypothetical protein